MKAQSKLFYSLLLDLKVWNQLFYISWDPKLQNQLIQSYVYGSSELIPLVLQRLLWVCELIHSFSELILWLFELISWGVSGASTGAGRGEAARGQRRRWLRHPQNSGGSLSLRPKFWPAGTSHFEQEATRKGIEAHNFVLKC